MVAQLVLAQPVLVRVQPGQPTLSGIQYPVSDGRELPMQKRVLIPQHTDIWRHLAAEEHLMGGLAPDECILYLWRSAEAVVIGKNQNPWLECRFAELEAAGGRLARRLSGGGAVFHDLGNLNFSFILNQANYDKEALARLVLKAVRNLGIDAAMGARHILTAGNRKFSGNASCLKRGKVIYHGTVLVNTDLTKLQYYLQPACAGIETRGIRSVPASVINLAELKPDLELSELVEAIRREFAPGPPETELAHPEIDELAGNYASWDWRFGKTPKFTASGRTELNGALFEFEAVVVKAIVTELTSMPTNPEFAGRFTGEPFAHLLTAVPNPRIT